MSSVSLGSAASTAAPPTEEEAAEPEEADAEEAQESEGEFEDDLCVEADPVPCTKLDLEYADFLRSARGWMPKNRNLCVSLNWMQHPLDPKKAGQQSLACHAWL